jgi:hypothetical protein
VGQLLRPVRRPSVRSQTPKPLRGRPLAQRLKIRIHCQDDHALADLRIDIGVQTHRPDSRDLIHLLAQPFAALVQEILPQSFDHLDAVGTIIYRDSTN